MNTKPAAKKNNETQLLAGGKPLSMITNPLLSWYSRAARDLPWRKTSDPYAVWVSEIMLQQTRVAAVIPYYLRFLEALPDLRSLAQVSEEKLLKLWEGLGYYSRVKNMQKTAQIICCDFGGTFPQTFEEVRSLPGIGDYTAGALCSIALDLPTPAVDGNVLRVVSRLYRCDRDLKDPAYKTEITGALREIYPEKRRGDFTQSLMELGALICLPGGAPLCESCPLASLCAAHASGEELLYPKKTEKPEKKHEEKTVFLIRCGDALALRKRPPKGLLSSLWELPNAEGKLDPQQAAQWLYKNGVEPLEIRPLPPKKHIFTHIVWEMQPYLVLCAAQQGDFCYADFESLSEEYSLPNAFRKLLPEKFS